MKKLLKILLGLLGAVAVLFVVLIAAVFLFVNPNDYKGEIIAQTKTHTGRELALTGDISLSIFPWVGFEIGEAALSNASGFGKEPFVQITGAGARIKLLPLLRGSVEVGTVYLNGLQLNLQTNAQGRTNWDDLVEATTVAAESSPQPVSPDTGGEVPADALAALKVEKLEISNARIHWQDQTSDTDIVVDELNLALDKVALNQWLGLHIGLAVQPELGQRIPLNIDSSIFVDLKNEQIKIKDMGIRFGQLAVQINAMIENFMQSPVAQADVSIPALNAQELLKVLNVDYEPEDANALKNINLALNINATAEQLEVSKLVLGLDNSTLKGKASVHNFAQPAIRFNFVLDQVNLDHYLPKGMVSASAGGEAAAPANASPLLLPVDTLRALDVAGEFKIGKMQAMNIKSSDITIRVQAKNGVLDFGPNEAKLYQGSYRGSTQIYVREAQPNIHMKENLSNVHLGDLLKDADLFDFFSGVGNVDLDLTTRAVEPQQAMKTLNGTVGLDIQNGILKGVDLEKIENQLEAAYKKARETGGLQGLTSFAKQLPDLAPAKEDQTKFTELKATAKITQGIANNEDLSIKTNSLRIKGAGKINLPREEIDNYRLTLGNFPILITGFYSKGVPSVLPDTKAMWTEYKKEHEQAAKQKLEKKIETKKDEKKEELKQKLEEKYKDKLKGLFK